MEIESRLNNELIRLKTLLDAHPVKHLSTGAITEDRLHKALVYLCDKSAKQANKHNKQERELRSCIADVLLLLDGFDINDQTRLVNKEFGTKKSPSIATEKSI